jgi:hypothetical protein
VNAPSALPAFVHPSSTLRLRFLYALALWLDSSKGTGMFLYPCRCIRPAGKQRVSAEDLHGAVMVEPAWYVRPNFA